MVEIKSKKNSDNFTSKQKLTDENTLSNLKRSKNVPKRKLTARKNAMLTQQNDDFDKGILLMMPQDFLKDNGNDISGDEGNYCLSQASLAFSKESDKPNNESEDQTPKPTEESTNIIKLHEPQDLSKVNEKEIMNIHLEESPKIPPKFHLEPLPTEFHLKDVAAGDEFIKRFKALREFMKARRKSSSQGDKRERRLGKTQKRKLGQKQSKLNSSEKNFGKSNKDEEKSAIKANLVITKIEKEKTSGKDKEKERQTAKNPKQDLQRIKFQKEKIVNLKKSDPEAASKLEEKSTWTNALSKARGSLVKDDESRLKKTIKRIDQRKKLSEKQWKHRVSSEKQAQRIKQEKRQQNVKARIEKIKTKKLDKRRR